MNLIINHVRQLDHMHNANRNFTFKTLASSAIIQYGLTITLHACFFHSVKHVILTSSIEYRCCYMNTKTQCCHPDMDFQHLTDVHPGA